MKIRGVILAAGSSTRMGSNKLALEVEGAPIIDRVINNARNSVLDETVLVWGRYDVETNLTKIYNPDHASGMSSSIKKGIEGFQGEAVMIILGDMPYITADVINQLCYAFKTRSKNIAVPVYKGRRGNPVIIGRKYFPELMNNTGDKGGRDIIKNNPLDIEFVEINDNSILIDIDDRSTYENINASGMSK